MTSSIILCFLWLTLIVFQVDASGQVLPVVRFAVIGDYGWSGQAEADVATMVRGWNPDFIVTTGDNNYDNGSASTIDQNIGQYYHQFIFPYNGAYGPGDTVNRFFPSLGNHDWVASGAQPYLNYFTLPGNERYYDFVAGNIHFFFLDSDPHEPDGTSSSSTQGQWLQGRLASSTARWKIVLFHHPPYSSGATHGSTTYMRWPFQQWGATAVLSGHEHLYERIAINNFPYMINGLGGKSLYAFGAPIAGSEVRYNANYGAQLVTANDDSIEFAFYSRTGTLVDRYVVGAGTTDSTVAYSLASGWNMLSVPLVVADYRKDVMFPSAISRASTYEGGYTAKETLRTGPAYWLKFAALETLRFAGTLRLTDTIEVVGGWNMIGSISVPVGAASVTSEPPGMTTSPFFGYSGLYSIADTIRPGKGYWMRAGQSGSLILSSSPSLNQASRITITPTSDLPPVPPSGADVKPMEIPTGYALNQNYPNPFNPTTTLKYQLPIDARVRLSIYDVLGQIVSTLADEVQQAGYKSIGWNAGSGASGVYFYRLEATSTADPAKTFTQVKKMILIR